MMKFVNSLVENGYYCRQLLEAHGFTELRDVDGLEVGQRALQIRFSTSIVDDVEIYVERMEDFVDFYGTHQQYKFVRKVYSTTTFTYESEPFIYDP